MPKYEQGSILRVDQLNFPVVVVSNKEFNKSGTALVCPFMKTAVAGPLHIPVAFGNTEGVVLCEQIKFLDLKKRHYSVAGAVDYYNIMDISDAVIGIVEYLN